MSRLQCLIVAITVALNAIDGFDVLAISFAAPGIAAQWGIDRAALGIVLSMELLGMAIGSVLLGGLADQVGRRPTIVGCLVIMAIGMLLASTARNVVELSTWRVITGLGIGGMLAALNAVAAEFSNARRRNFCVSLMAIGYPIGAVLGGLVVAQLLKVHDWRSVFLLGASVTAIFIPIVIFVLPESLHWLVRRQPPGALQKVRRTMSRLQLPPVDDLPPLAAVDKRRSPAELFTGDLRTVTILVSFAYFLHITTFYFILKWVPKIVVDMGFDASAAAGVLVWANVGGASGGALLGYLAQHHNLKHLTVGTLLLSGVMVGYFGHSAPDLAQLSYACAAAAFFCNAGIVGLYALFAQLFPTHLRASGTGFAIGFGRGGAVLSPIAAGAMLASGSDLSRVAIAMGLGSFAAACLILWLRTQRR